MALEFRSLDGTGNNLADPTLNSAGTNFARIGPANFADDWFAMVDAPNARMISNVVVGGGGNGGTLPNPEGFSAFMFAWGQMIDHDLDLAMSDGVTAISITMPADDPYFPASSFIPLTRSIIDPSTGTSGHPATAINFITGWLDGSMVYGSSAATAASLRLADGHMKTTAGDNLPVEGGMFVAGDVRVAENPDLTALQTLFVREHNLWVDKLHLQHPEWTGDDLYNHARAIVAAEIANITYNEFLPHLIGANAIAPYAGYNPTVDPRITEQFAGAAFRFGHSLVAADIGKSGELGERLSTESLKDSFFAPNSVYLSNGGTDALLRNLAETKANALDSHIVDDLRNFLNVPPASLDLAAINIQRGRDLGLGTLNQTRIALGFAPYASFDDLTSDHNTALALETAYGNIDSVELWVGGLSEDHAPGAMVGETFQAIIAYQFTVLRDGDRLWYEGQGFDAETLAAIKQTKLSDIIERNTDIGVIQDDVFVYYDRHSGIAAGIGADNPDAPQLVVASPENDTLLGGAQNDVLSAGAGNQTLYGAAGDDQLTGGAGNDFLDGAEGNDTAYYTGNIADYSVTSLGAGIYRIVDLRPGSPDGTDIVAGVDALFFADQPICVSPADAVNDAPTDLTLTNASVAENSAVGIVVGTLLPTDADVGETFTFTVLDDAGGLFALNGTDLVVNGAIDYEEAPSHQVTVQVTDAEGASYSEQFVIAIDNVSGVTITGGAGNNTINATSTPAGQQLPTGEEDTINAGGGNDNVSALGGNDVVNGDIGADTIDGGAGDDTLHGNNAFDLLIGGTGDDSLFGDNGNDTLAGGFGSDTLDGGLGADSMSGGQDDDVYVVDNAADVVTETGGSGTDTVRSSINFKLEADFENLELTGLLNLSGTGNELDNHLTGNGGNNILAGLAGADTLDGGDGTDRATYSMSLTGVNVSLAGHTASGGDAQGDVLLNIEDLMGSAAADTLEGDDGDNLLNGGAGIDTVSYEHAGGGVTVNLSTSGPQATSGAGTDTLLNFENITGSGFGDVLSGTSGDNTMLGLNGGDTLSGLAGNDQLDGGAGNDTLNGNLGQDTLIGGTGSDTLVGGMDGDRLTGGTGEADTFVFTKVEDSTPAHFDAITDFEHGLDHIDLSGIDANTAAGSDQAFLSASANGSVVAHSVTWFESGGNTIVRADVNGNATADFFLVLSGTGLNLAQSDFML